MRVAWSTGTILLLSSLVAGTSCQGIAAAQYYGSAPSHQAAPQPGAAAQDLEAVEALREIESNYMRAEMEGSAKLAGAILADDYLGIRSDGTAMDKAEVLNNLANYSRTRERYSITATNMREHVFGDTACVTYTKVYTLPVNSASYSENLLHVFTKRNGLWRLQVSSPMPTPRPQGAAEPNAQP
jgi:hypothetical protein